MYRVWDKQGLGTIYQLVAPLGLRAEIFKQLHGSRQGGHLGVKRTLCMVRSRFFWAQVKRDIQQWCRECDDCAQVKGGPRRNARIQQEAVGGRFEQVAIDIMGELRMTVNENR